MYGSWKIALVGFTIDFAIHGRYFIKCDSHVGFIRIVVKCNNFVCNFLASVGPRCHSQRICAVSRKWSYRVHNSLHEI